MLNTVNPLQLLSDLAGAARDKLGTPKLPDWLDHELRNRLLLLINHLLQQHPQARQQLLAHKDKVLRAQWNSMELRLQVTPAGLFALADASQREHLQLQVQEHSPVELARLGLLGQRPQVHITGDAEFADAIHWLGDNVRWNGEADLARLVGEDAARRIASVLRHAHHALQAFAHKVTPAPGAASPPAHSAAAGSTGHAAGNTSGAGRQPEQGPQ